MTVGVGGHVHRHAVDRRGEVGPVVEVEAAQEILVGFAVAAVLGDDEPRHHFQHLARAQQRTALEFLRGHGALARRIRIADQLLLAAGDDDHFLQIPGGNSPAWAAHARDEKSARPASTAATGP